MLERFRKQNAGHWTDAPNLLQQLSNFASCRNVQVCLISIRLLARSDQLSPTAQQFLRSSTNVPMLSETRFKLARFGRPIGLSCTKSGRVMFGAVLE